VCKNRKKIIPQIPQGIKKEILMDSKRKRGEKVYCGKNRKEKFVKLKIVAQFSKNYSRLALVNALIKFEASFS